MKSLPNPHLYPMGLLRKLIQAVLAIALFSSPSLAELTQEQAAQNRAIAKKLLKSVKPGQREVDLGCVKLWVEQLQAMASDDKTGFIMEPGVEPFTYYWPDGIVPYTFNPPGIEDGTLDTKGIVADGRKELIRAAMDEWENSAQLTFVEVPLNNPGVDNYIIFNDHPTSNNSNLGKWLFPAPQNINMVSWGFAETKAIIIHEIGHALGLWHEQARSDRDTYVEIRNENVDDDFEDQFVVQATDNIGEYDFGSVMHYGRTAFSINGQNTIVMRPGFEQFQNTIGQRVGLSDLDRAGMAAKYGALTPTNTPSFQPLPGNYDAPIQFSLIILPAIDQGTTRYFYTLDGSTPTTSSLEYFPGDVIPINSNTTVKYFALQQQHSPSLTLTANYTFTNPTPMVATPVMNPLSGTYAPGTMFSVSTSTPDAQIYLTFGPTVPTQSGFQYTAPFPLNSNTQINAKAFKAGHTPSGVATANYEIQANQLSPPPGFYPDPNAQEYPGPLNVYPVNNSTILGTELRYTLDGNEPTTASPIFAETPLILTQDTTVKAKLFRDGFTPSLTSTANYNVIAAADVPIINPNGGNFTGSVSVSLSLPTKSTKGTSPANYIYYTTNGGDPGTFSTKYTTPFNLGVGTHTVKARTIFPGLPPSAIAQAQFTVFSDAPAIQNPQFLPVAGQHINSVQVTIQSFTEGATIRYTVGDNVAPADPTVSTGNVYSGPFNLGLTPGEGDFWFLRAKAFKDGAESSLVPKTYSVVEPLGTINAPVFDPPGGGTYDNPITVNMSATTVPPTAGVQVYRTTNGADPFVPDPPIGGSLTVNLIAPTDLKALAYRDFFGESDITTASYTFKCATPTIEVANSKQVDYYGAVTVIMSSTTTGGNTSIRYELGGLEPTNTSTLYAAPFELGTGVHVVKAKTFRNNFEDSDTAVASFIVSETPEAPTITLDPASIAVDAFTDHTFVAAAIGVPTPEYSWYFHATSATQAVRLAGEFEASLTLFNIQVSSQGDYYLIASNSAGSATSEFATLIVNQVDTPTPSQTFTPSQTLTPSETPTGTLPTPTPSNTTIDGGTATATSTPSITPTPTEIMAQKVILSASQDNTLIEDLQGDRSNALTPYFFAGSTGVNAEGGIRRGILAFDVVGSVSAGSTITAVTLTLNLSKVSSAAAESVTIHSVSASWGEGTSTPTPGKPEGGIGGPATSGDATWLHRFYDTVNWNNQGGDFEDTASATQTVENTGSYNWGSTSRMVEDVQSWLDDPSGNYGWVVIGNEATSNTAKRFDSRENSNEANRPMLCIEYLPFVEEVTPTPTATVEDATETATPTPTMEEATSTPTITNTPRFTPAPVEIMDVDINDDLIIDELDLLEFLKYWKQQVQ